MGTNGQPPSGDAQYQAQQQQFINQMIAKRNKQMS